MWFPEDLEEGNPEDGRADFIDIAEQHEIAEGDISVSETVDGHEALPTLDDTDMIDDIEDADLTVLDEDNPELGLSYEVEDEYLEGGDDDDLDDTTLDAGDEQ